MTPAVLLPPWCNTAGRALLTGMSELQDVQMWICATDAWKGKRSCVGFTYRRPRVVPLDDWRRVLTTSSGHVTTAPAVPPALGIAKSRNTGTFPKEQVLRKPIVITTGRSCGKNSIAQQAHKYHIHTIITQQRKVSPLLQGTLSVFALENMTIYFHSDTI